MQPLIQKIDAQPSFQVFSEKFFGFLIYWFSSQPPAYVFSLKDMKIFLLDQERFIVGPGNINSEMDDQNICSSRNL